MVLFTVALEFKLERVRMRARVELQTASTYRVEYDRLLVPNRAQPSLGHRPQRRSIVIDRCPSAT
jgi:hypothetical protein